MWTNYGDANPLEWGGLWIDKDTDREHCYRAIMLDVMDDGYLFNDCYVDVTESWINWEEVLSYVGESSLKTEVDKVIALLSYYSVLNFGSYERVLSEEEVLKELEAYEILAS